MMSQTDERTLEATVLAISFYPKTGLKTESLGQAYRIGIFE